LVLSSIYTWNNSVNNENSGAAYSEFNDTMTRSFVRSVNNTEPILKDFYVYIEDGEANFEVNYTDLDGDEGTVLLYIDDKAPKKMRTADFDPTEGQYYFVYIAESEIDDYSEFYITADDNNGSTITLKDEFNQPFVLGDLVGWGEPPVLSSPNVYFDGDDWVFNVTYWDPDGDWAEDVWLNIEGQDSVTMSTDDPDPEEGQIFFAYVLESRVDETTEFYITTLDVNGSYAQIYDKDWENFIVGDFLGNGEEPILSNPDIFAEGNNWIFNITYRDPDGDNTQYLRLFIDDKNPVSMETVDANPSEGQNYVAYVPKVDVYTSSDFYFQVLDTGGSYASLYDEDGDKFIVWDFLDSDEPGNGDKDDGAGIKFGRWGDPEVIVGIVALIAMGIGSGIGIWLRRRKRKRFSDLLSKIDEVYDSFKMHPRKCDRELEKIKNEVDSDLKTNVIDENNYSILKDRINEITQEIRQESVRSKVGELPKDIELSIKDMLIDGKISRKEYNKFMVALKGSDMGAKDKKQMEKLLDSWMKKDKKK
jgi:hypothetical protein